jgi:hypothetical protein
LQGFRNQAIIAVEDQVNIVTLVSSALSNPSLYEYRETALREAILLAIRSIITSYPIICKKLSISRHLVQSLVYLQARLASDDAASSALIIDAAKKELLRLAVLQDLMIESSASSESIVDEIQAKLSSSYPTFKIFSHHFDSILSSIVPADKPIPTWSSSDFPRAALEVLVREATQAAWKAYSRVIAIILENIQPKAGPASGSVEANMASYAAIRGDEAIPSVAEVDVRLSLLALLEGMIRSGSMDWECSPYMAEAADSIIRLGLIPNLVWKVSCILSLDHST